MSLDHPSTPLLQRAALAVHALAAADRRWILEALTPPQRQALEPLLAELRELGLPVDAELLQDVQAPARTAPPPWPMDLDERGVAALARVLNREPLAITRQLLALQPWPWRASLLAFVPGARRHLLDAVSSRPAPNQCAAASLMKSLEFHVGEESRRAATGAAEAAGKGPWSRVRSRLSRLGRRP